MYEDIVDELKYHGVHTIILYGSRARGDFTPTSDIDIIGFRNQGENFRIARWDEKYQCYLDIFVETFKELNVSYFKLAEGKILLDKDNFGKNLLSQIDLAILLPNVLSKNELETRAAWYQKMVERAKTQDIEGLYRHQWALNTLIEDYFAFRGKHYLGPKKGFQYLKKYDIKCYDLYLDALQSTQDISKLQAVLNAVIHTPEANLFYSLNELASKINAWLEFHEGIPRINYGPCGVFAYEFMQAWNQKFTEKVHIVFILTPDELECDHVLVRLPTGELFDGGLGVHHEESYLDKFKIIDMNVYQHELLEKWSYGLDRTYPRFCPDFDRDKLKGLIGDFFRA